MITRTEFNEAREKTIELLLRTGIVVSESEIDHMEVVDFGLSELDLNGVQIITLVDTDMITVKLLILTPNQTEPEHKHPQIGDYPGKEETIRCEWGKLYLYGPGEPTSTPKGHPPEHSINTFTVWHEYLLSPGEQVTFQPNTPHWFQAGPEGAVIWSFSTKAVDIEDIFTDPQIVRDTIIVDSCTHGDNQSFQRSGLQRRPFLI